MIKHGEYQKPKNLEMNDGRGIPDAVGPNYAQVRLVSCLGLMGSEKELQAIHLCLEPLDRSKRHHKLGAY
jgi:hypothetical protein